MACAVLPAAVWHRAQDQPVGGGHRRAPYGAIFDYANETLNIAVTFGNYLFLLSDSLYISAYWGSVKIAFLATLICLLIGYPMAYAMARAPAHLQLVLLLLVMLPSWTSFLIRVYAWMGILSNNGLINNTLMWLGLIESPLRMMNTNFAVILGIVYAYLPFMVLPLYANLTRLDGSLLEAASDLGSRKFNTFLRVTLPLSKGASSLARCWYSFLQWASTSSRSCSAGPTR